MARGIVSVTLLWSLPLLLHAEPGNDSFTLIQDSVLSGGGQTGGGNPMVIWTAVGDPIGGPADNATFAVLGGYYPAISTSPAGTRTITVEGLIDDPLASVIINGIEATVNGTTVTAEGVELVEGPNTITATATDPAGHTFEQSITVYLDTQPPAMPTLEPPPAVVAGANYTLQGTKTPGTSIWINGVEVVPLDDLTIWSVTVDLVEGDNILTIVTKDAAGNVSASVIVNIIVDELPPVISDLTYHDPDGVPLVLDPSTSLPKTNFSPVTITGTVDDSLTDVEINGLLASRDGQDFEVDVPLVEGSNTLTLIATSPNQHVTTEALDVLMGTIPTIDSIEPSPGSKPYLGLVTPIQVTATDAEGDPLECQILLDDQVIVDWTTGASHPWVPTEAQLGLHTIEVRVRDGFGGWAVAQSEVYVLRVPISPP